MLAVGYRHFSVLRSVVRPKSDQPGNVARVDLIPCLQNTYRPSHAVAHPGFEPQRVCLDLFLPDPVAVSPGGQRCVFMNNPPSGSQFGSGRSLFHLAAGIIC
jgi:hypothetical protein